MNKKTGPLEIVKINFKNYLSPNIGLHGFAEAGNVTNSFKSAISPEQNISASFGAGFAFALNPQVRDLY